FAHSLNKNAHLVAFYGICLGLGEFVGGLFVSFLSRRIHNFSLTPTMLCHAALSICFQTLVLLAFPNWSTARPSGGEGLLLSPTVLICVICGLLVGLADSTITTARTVVCQIAVPHRRPQAFSLSRLIQSISSSVTLFLSPQMSVASWTVAVLVMLAIGTTSFGYVATETTKVSPDETNDGAI
ncbi:hypothetical protein OSTOST_22249, partial [Ostertagia ostertagi]